MFILLKKVAPLLHRNSVDRTPFFTSTFPPSSFSSVVFDVCSCHLPKAARSCLRPCGCPSCCRATLRQAAGSLPALCGGVCVCQLAGTHAAFELTIQSRHQLSTWKHSAASVLVLKCPKHQENDIKHIT